MARVFWGRLSVLTSGTSNERAAGMNQELDGIEGRVWRITSRVRVATGPITPISTLGCGPPSGARGSARLDRIAATRKAAHSRIIAMVSARVEHPFGVIRRQSGHVKTRFRRPARGRARHRTRFKPGNLFAAGRRRMASGRVCPENRETAPGAG
jgi:hypothetical protein